MNELKPEDVMRALECCSQEGMHWCSSCPFYDMHNSFCQEDVHMAALAILREKDEELAIAKNERDEARRDCAMAERNHFESAQSVKDLLTELQKKDAEIERLSHHCDDCAGCTQWNCDCSNIRAEAITEFEQRLITYYNALKSGLVAYHIEQVAKELREKL